MVISVSALLGCSAPARRGWHLPDAGSPGAPHSVWIAPPHAVKTPVADGTELPVWALEAACAEYAPRGGTVAVLNGPAAATTRETVESASLAPDWLRAAEEVELPLDAGAHLALAVVLDDPDPHADPESHHDPAFYRDLRAALAPGGIALVHTHTAHGPGGLIDPAAAILRDAQAAGLGYLQHVVIVHTRLDAPTTPRYRIPNQKPVPPVCRRVHSDLYALTAEGDAR